MLFCSQTFLFFFVFVFTLYWAMPWQRARVWLLLCASFFFYACWNEWLALLVGVSTFIDYWLARGMDAWTKPAARRALLLFSVIGNLTLLGYFKYVNFFIESLQASLNAVGASVSFPLLEVLLPIGISFYTFEAINYTVDVYRRKVRAERELGHFMLFITFFPHLVAGPIVRARDFLPQIHRPKQWNWARLQLGVGMFLMGLFKKLAIADRMAVLADPVFAAPDSFRTHTVWLAAFAYAVQVYCDFSGYTDMAIGLAHMFGYKLAPNFNMPFLSANISEFWRRWHISLSSWLRDYLFIPLGGSRDREWRTARNLLITMTLAGLWHGANWNFVVFGAIQGMLLIGHRWFRALASHLPRLDWALNTRFGTAACVVLTFVTFCCTLVVFRATSLTLGGQMLQRMFVLEDGLRTPVPSVGLAATFAVVALCHWLGRYNWLRITSMRAPWQTVAVGYCTIFMAALILAPRSGQAFIYFQF
ncbi:MAG: MBOAT family protein [Planctomycetes bacterium]|nr:MBOAT family protein [Planctomycetota bacterium]